MITCVVGLAVGFVVAGLGLPGWLALVVALAAVCAWTYVVRGYVRRARS